MAKFRKSINSLKGCRITKITNDGRGGLVFHGSKSGGGTGMLFRMSDGTAFYDGDGNYFDQDSILALDSP